MQKSVIVFAALPIAFAAAGYAGGQVLPTPPAAAVYTAAETPEPTRAAMILEELAAQEENQSVAKDSHAPQVAPAAEEAKAEPAPLATGPDVVRLGQMRVPVYRADNVTYVISEISVQMRDQETATRFSEAQNTARLRDAVLVSLHGAAQGLSLTGSGVRKPELSERLAADLRAGFGQDVAQVLLLSLVQAEVPRS